MITRREKEDNLFFKLQQEALKKLQALSGNRWTDYNAHDPGITILEAAHYALLELQYRLDLPLDSYLSGNNKIKFDKLGLFLEKITAPSIVTTADYENLVKTVPGVAQCRVTLSRNHTYNIQVVPEENADKQQVEKEIEKAYNENRNLCERLGKIIFEKNILCPGTKTVAGEAPAPAVNVGPHTQGQPFSTTYYSLQNHFPDCYGINEKGLPAGSGKLRQAQALQLKAYLLIFDYLIANTLHQAGNTKQLLTLSGKIPSPYQTNFSIEDMNQLVDKKQFENHPLQNDDFLNKQKSYVLDNLDVIYGEDTRRFFTGEHDVKKTNEKRAQLIYHLPELNKNRFRAINLLENTGENKSGIEQFIDTVTGNRGSAGVPVINLFSSYNLHLLDDETFFAQYRNMNMEYIFQYFDHHEPAYTQEPIPVIETKTNRHTLRYLEQNLNFFWHNTLFESLLTEGTNPGNYRIVKASGKEYNTLVFKLKEKNSWINLGYAFQKEKLIHIANLLWKFLKMLREKTSVFYLIEHILLDENAGDYNKLSLIIPAWSVYAGKNSMLEKLVHERIPAHLDIRFIRMNARRLYQFEHIYYLWRNALGTKDEEVIRENLKQILKEES